MEELEPERELPLNWGWGPEPDRTIPSSAAQVFPLGCPGTNDFETLGKNWDSAVLMVWPYDASLSLLTGR